MKTVRLPPKPAKGLRLLSYIRFALINRFDLRIV